MCWFYTLPAIRNHIFAAFVIIISHFIFNGYAIKCFVCDSTDNPSCSDLKSNSSIVAEECTLLKMKSIDSWLFELNRLDFYENAPYNKPLFTCQKVVALEPQRDRLVTARFCQLHTAESDACKILENKMAKQETERQSNNGFGLYTGGRGNSDSSGNRRNNAYDSNKNGNNDDGDDGSQTRERLEHCSVCEEDRCNAGISLFTAKASFMHWQLLLLLAPLVYARQLLRQTAFSFW